MIGGDYLGVLVDASPSAGLALGRADVSQLLNRIESVGWPSTTGSAGTEPGWHVQIACSMICW